MATVNTDAEAFQDLDRLRERIDYAGTDFFNDNEQLRFDELLVKLERESRGIFVTLWGDETPLEELGREDVKRATDDAAMLLAYPVNDVSQVEIKRTMNSDWEALDDHQYDYTKHRLVLARRSSTNTIRYQQSANSLLADAGRATWRDIAEKVRVTYDRGFGTDPPGDILSIQVQLINRMLRNRKREQTTAAASPEELAGQVDTAEVLTEEIRNRISDVTSPGGATISV